jgi:hypothetical protein
MSKKLPKFSGRPLDEKSPNILNSDYPVKPNKKIEIPKLEDEKNQTEKKPADLFQKLKNLLEPKNQVVSKNTQNTNNNYNKQLLTVLNNTMKLFKSSLVSKQNQTNSPLKTEKSSFVEKIKTVPTVTQTIISNTNPQSSESNTSYSISPQSSQSNTSYSISPQNEKMISIMNTFMGKNPSSISSTLSKNKIYSNKLNNFYVSKNKQNEIKNMSYLNKNMSYITDNNKTENEANEIKNSKVYMGTNTEINKDTYLNNNRENINNSSANLNSNTIISRNNRFSQLEKITDTLKSQKSSVERQPYFFKEKGANFIYLPNENKKILSFYEGGNISVKGSQAGTQLNLSVGEKGRKENVSVTPMKETYTGQQADALKQAALDESGGSSNEKGKQKEQEMEKNVSSAGSSVANNVSVMNLSKTITTFEKVAIETFMVPGWRRVLG